MTFTSYSPFDNLIPNDIILPKEQEELNIVLTDYFRYLVDRSNLQEVALYDTSEIINGQQWFNPTDRQNIRGNFRNVINFGALPNAATKSVAHGIAIDSNFIFTKIYATATNPTAGAPPIKRAIPIPYINTTAPGDSVELYVDNTNVSMVTTTANYTQFTQCYVVLEYLKS